MNVLLIEVFKENESLDIREGISPKTQKPWKMITQIGYAHTGDKFPIQMKIKMQDGQPIYQAGMYELGKTSLSVNPYGDLEIGREMILIPHLKDGKF